jgi:mono/diheme cytochrome c family protein
MKCKSFLAVTVVATSLVFLPKPSGAADDGAALYKSKCAGCHGAQGEGKPAVKAPALKGTALTTDQIAAHITKGEASSKAPHKKGIAGVSATQAKAIAEFIKTLK